MIRIKFRTGIAVVGAWEQVEPSYYDSFKNNWSFYNKRDSRTYKYLRSGIDQIRIDREGRVTNHQYVFFANSDTLLLVDYHYKITG